MGKIEKDKLYISFHKPRNVIGFLISTWTLGKYSHCEFVYNGYVYLANPGGVRKQPFIYKRNMDIYEVVGFDAQEILDFFKVTEGKGYDYFAIFGSQLFYFLNAQDDDKFFCSEWCLNALDYSADYKLSWRGKKIKEKGYHKFNPERLFKYLKSQFFIKEVM